jgi:hypothetical protein
VRLILVGVLLAIASPAAAERACVAIKKGKKLYAKKGKTAVGKTTAPVAVTVEARKGAWLQVSRQMLASTGGDDVSGAGSVRFWVRRKDTRAGSCPPGPNVAVLGAVSFYSDLRWRDGTEAGAVLSGRISSEYRCANQTMALADETYRCFPWTPVEGLAVTVCAAPSGQDPRGGGGPRVDPEPCP